jgi:hypothetical protein
MDDSIMAWSLDGPANTLTANSGKISHYVRSGQEFINTNFLVIIFPLRAISLSTLKAFII